MTRFWTSDPHFGHQNIIQYCNRPFADVPTMNDEMVNRWNSVVTESDEVMVLGDVAMGKFAESITHISRLNGRKILVPGNHDRCWEGHKKARQSESKYLDAGFSEILQPPFMVTLHSSGRTEVQVSHFPYKDHTDPRYEEWRPQPRGNTWLIHGHVHDKWIVRGRQLNVGVDVWDFTPVSEQELVGTIRTHEKLKV